MKDSSTKDFLQVLILGIVVIFITAFSYQQIRHFYKLSNYTFTVWKRAGGNCYITPYKHLGISLPEEDYLIAPNLGSLSIFVKPDSTLVIFNGEPIDGEFKIYLDNYKYEFIDWGNEERKRKWEECRIYPCIRISIREPSVKYLQPIDND